MPNPTQQTLAQLRAQIKREARVEGSDNLDTFIDELVNELLVQYAWKHRYPELLVLNSEIPAVTDTAAYSLPANFMALRLVRYRFTSRSLRILREVSGYAPNPREGSPRYYTIAGNSINLLPSGYIYTGETLVLDYYKLPDTLAAGDVFPIPRIFVPLKQEAVARTHTYNKELEAAGVLKGSSSAIEMKSEGVSAG